MSMVRQGFVAHTAQRVRSSPATMAMAGTPRGSRQHARTGRYECTWLYHTEAIVKGILGVMRVILVHLQNQRMLCSSRWVIPGLTEGVKRDGRQTGGCRRQPVFGPRAGARADVTAPGPGCRRDGWPGCCGQHKSNTSPGPGGIQHADNTYKTAFPGTLWHGC